MTTRTRSILAAIVAATVILGASACSASTPAAPATSTNTSPPLSGSITVFAAASLKGTFTELANRFKAKHPGTTVSLSFAGSSDLATQITAGAPADVFASADTKNMAKLTAAGLVDGEPVDFATNTLEIAVPPANPAAIASLADLARPGVKTVVCQAQVPCGSTTVAVEKAAGVTIRPVSEELSVTDVLGKVSSGEADAGLVYVTDVKAAGASVTGIPFPESAKAVNTYPIAALTAGARPAVAAAFVQFVVGTTGRLVLAAAGFGSP
ncbi:molybdate ABC transporter substrate-binding protein [Lacisediminihabitans sp.]|uniref:molybdate ABC transporter substrate-binding protein n=1 Tax=Lacisediminihabitans sp. TaxID=2787631 RepID=UPI00374CC030